MFRRVSSTNHEICDHTSTIQGTHCFKFSDLTVTNKGHLCGNSLMDVCEDDCLPSPILIQISSFPSLVVLHSTHKMTCFSEKAPQGPFGRALLSPIGTSHCEEDQQSSQGAVDQDYLTRGQERSHLALTEVLFHKNFLSFGDKGLSLAYKHWAYLPRNMSLPLVRWRDPISLKWQLSAPLLTYERDIPPDAASPFRQQKGQPQQDSSQQALYWSRFMVDRIDEEQRTQTPSAHCLYTVQRNVSTSDWSSFLLSIRDPLKMPLPPNYRKQLKEHYTYILR
ncbi:hypothetical protein STEG23_005765, partial [Scotinomys teguina]